jgi:uncharacterized Tic20 family protein
MDSKEVRKLIEDMKELFMKKGKSAVVFAVALFLLSIFSPLFITQAETLGTLEVGSYIAIPTFMQLFFYFIALIMCLIVALAYLADFLGFTRKQE